MEVFASGEDESEADYPLNTWPMTVKSAFPLTPHFATSNLDKNPNLYFW
jgi:hypothetical protein